MGKDAVSRRPPNSPNGRPWDAGPEGDNGAGMSEHRYLIIPDEEAQAGSLVLEQSWVSKTNVTSYLRCPYAFWLADSGQLDRSELLRAC